MLVSLLCILSFFGALSEGGIYTNPIWHVDQDPGGRQLHTRAEQIVLSGDSPSAKDADMWYTPGPFGLATVAALGNPPQPFRLYVDLVWDTLFVPNASLSTQYCSPGFEMFRYRANASSTAEPSELGWYHLEQNLVYFSGPAALDTFRVGGGRLRVERQPFVAVEHAQPASMLHLWINYDGVLGLSPRWNAPAEPTASHLPSPWARMVRDGVLDDNVFAIEVPRAARGGFDYDGSNGDVGATAGAMTFGGVADKYQDAAFAALPLVRDDDRVWAVAAQSVRWTNRTQPIDYRFHASTVAVFSTQWFIGLPRPLAARIHRSIPAWAGKRCGMGLACVIHCAARRHLPDLVFELAGQRFTVTAFQYAYRVVNPKGGDHCTFNIFPTSGYTEEGGPIPEDAVILGSPFLNAYYSVYDSDNMEIRVTEVKD